MVAPKYFVEVVASAATATLVVTAVVLLPVPRLPASSSAAEAALTAATRYSIDSVSFGGTTIVLHWHPQPAVATSRDAEVVFSGWAADDRSIGRRPAAVTAIVDGSAAFPAVVGLPRRDVAAYFKDSALADSGFRISIPSCALAAGNHVVAFRIETAGRSGYYRSTDDVAMNVRPANCSKS